jgi:hypothetical protein
MVRVRNSTKRILHNCWNALSGKIPQNQINVPKWGQTIGEEWNVFSIKTSSFNKKDNWNVVTVVCLRTLKNYEKIEGRVNIFSISGVKCLNQRRFNDITSRYF